MTIFQLVPSLDGGRASRSVAAIHRALVSHGFIGAVISKGGPFVSEIVSCGDHHLQDMQSRDPLTIPGRAAALSPLIEAVSPDVLHVHGCVPAWIATFANRDLGIPMVSTLYRPYPDNAFSEVMFRVDHVIDDMTGAGLRAEMSDPAAVVDHTLAVYRDLVCRHPRSTRPRANLA